MKTSSLKTILAAAVGLVAAGALCSAQQPSTTQQATEPPVVAPTGASMSVATSPAQVAQNYGPDVAADRWLAIKDYTYDMRDRFFAGLQVLEATVDTEIGQLNAKRRSVPSTADMQEWDFNMKEMSRARAYLQDMGDQLRKVSPESWDQQKAKVGEAWHRTQEDYSKVKMSTTL